MWGRMLFQAFRRGGRSPLAQLAGLHPCSDPWVCCICSPWGESWSQLPFAAGPRNEGDRRVEVLTPPIRAEDRATMPIAGWRGIREAMGLGQPA
ncbi:hypothetical protein CA234_22390 [Sphingomonas sp. ABOLE]|nr:hypothetical protein CA234_22390 [Sphingomonas sp. ABOLE]